MASYSGNSSVPTQLQNSAFEGGDLVNERKRKRKQSNLESARRSRMRKQKHVDELMAQVYQLRKENNQMLTNTSITTQHYLNLEAENSILRVQVDELSQRLQSLDNILNYMNTSNNNGMYFETDNLYGTHPENFMNNTWNMMYLNQQPIMASANTIFQY